MSSWLYRWPDLALSSYVSKGVFDTQGSRLLEELSSSQQPMMVLLTCITPSQLASLPSATPEPPTHWPNCPLQAQSLRT